MKKRKITSLFLTLVMVLSLVPAMGVTSYATGWKERNKQLYTAILVTVWLVLRCTGIWCKIRASIQATDTGFYGPSGRRPYKR